MTVLTNNLLDLTGRVVAVIGGGSVAPGWSIGRASCLTYARQGAHVCVLDREIEPPRVSWRPVGLSQAATVVA